MNKELLTVEFRYHDSPNPQNFSGGFQSKMVTIGIYDTLEDAVKAGNDIIRELSDFFKMQGILKVKGLFGQPDRLVASYGPNAEVYVKITQLKYTDSFKDICRDVIQAKKRHAEWLETQ